MVRAGAVVLGWVVVIGAAREVSAQTRARLDASAAQSMVDACAVHATRKGQSHAIAVVDGGGSLVAFLRMDGNTPGVAEFARRKAEAVAHWRFSTEEMLGAAESTPGFADAPRIVTVAGGVPIFSGDGSAFLGAVGVSGEAPGDDAECAAAGIEAAGFRSRRN
jgi:uncharacterized protein GlcG (DUF336 family)